MTNPHVEKWQKEAQEQFEPVYKLLDSADKYVRNPEYDISLPASRYLVESKLNTLIFHIIADTERTTVNKIKELVAYSSFDCDAGGRVSDRQDDAETVCHEIIADIDKMFTPPPQETVDKK